MEQELLLDGTSGTAFVVLTWKARHDCRLEVCLEVASILALLYVIRPAKGMEHSEEVSMVTYALRFRVSTSVQSRWIF